MRGHPRPRVTLRSGDLGLRHLAGHFLAQSNGVLAALQRGEVEPFVRGDKVDQARAAARPIDPTLEQNVRQRARIDRRCRIEIESTLKHNASPFSCAASFPRARLPSNSDLHDPFWDRALFNSSPKSSCPMPFAGLLEAMMAGKFEWQFKYRDEADV